MNTSPALGADLRRLRRRYRVLGVAVFGALCDTGGPSPALAAAMTAFSASIALLGLLAGPRFADPAQTPAPPARRTS